MGRSQAKSGFTLIELLMVLGIITVLVGIFLPTLTNARRDSERLRCQSNMRQVGQQMLIYANENRGWLFPPMAGVNVPPAERWPVKVFKFSSLPASPTDEAADYMPKLMLCPTEPRDVVLEPSANAIMKPGQLNVHTYVVSHNLRNEEITFSKRNLGGLTPSQFVIMGEKHPYVPDLYMGTRSDDPSEFRRVVNFYKHGLKVGSNYLLLDMHVETLKEQSALKGIDPWTF